MKITKAVVAGLVASTAISGLAYMAKGGPTRIQSRTKNAKHKSTNKKISNSAAKRKIDVESDEPEKGSDFRSEAYEQPSKPVTKQESVYEDSLMGKRQ